jgi:hypothetical protein
MGAQWRRGSDRRFAEALNDPCRNVLKYPAVSKTSVKELRIDDRGGIS